MSDHDRLRRSGRSGASSSGSTGGHAGRSSRSHNRYANVQLKEDPNTYGTKRLGAWQEITKRTTRNGGADEAGNRADPRLLDVKYAPTLIPPDYDAPLQELIRHVGEMRKFQADWDTLFQAATMAAQRPGESTTGLTDHQLANLRSQAKLRFLEIRKFSAQVSAYHAASWAHRELTALSKGHTVGYGDPGDPSYAKEFAGQLKHNLNPKPLARASLAKLKHVIARSEALRKKDMAKGNYLGAAFASAKALTESVIEDALALQKAIEGSLRFIGGARKKAETDALKQLALIGLGGVIARMSPFGKRGARAVPTGQQMQLAIAGVGPMPAAAAAHSLSHAGIIMAVIPKQLTGKKEPKGLLGPASTKKTSAIRKEPGVAYGANLPDVKGRWLRSGQEGRIPGQIARKLAGRKFKNWDAFREAFWKEVAADPVLAPQFTKANRSNMSQGKAPGTILTQHVGKTRKTAIHHLKFIGDGGPVFDMTNLRVVAPRRHQMYHQGK